LAVISGSYLREQAEILIAISRTTFDLVVARRLREIASGPQNQATQQDAETSIDSNKLRMRS
jgi:hypothetical protein